MAADPDKASELLPAFSAIPNMPTAVTTDVITALGNRSLFEGQIAAARAALISSGTSTTTIAGLLGL
jgi:hypothetical protein